MKITCLECGTGYDVLEGGELSQAKCPKCDSTPSQYFPYAKTVTFEQDTDPAKGETKRRSLPRVPERLGKYHIQNVIGQGGMGVVYRARHDELDRTVALKVIIAGEHAGQDTIQRFQREARSAAKLTHPNIVQVYDVGQEGPLSYFVMEYVDGRTLDQSLRDRRIEPREGARIIRDVARALSYAHAEGIIHRDLKPGNILLDRYGSPKLVDFGLAKSVAGETKITRTGEIIGTACYMSPEQAGGHGGEIDAQSDLYSLGSVLYEILTGRPPFTGDSVVAILRDVEEGETELPTRINRSIPADLETICMKAMAREKPRRYATAAEMAEDLDAFLEGRPIHARRSSVLYRGSRWARRHPRVTTAACMLLIGLAVGTAFTIRGRERIGRAEDAKRRLAEARPHFLEAQNHFQIASNLKKRENRIHRREKLRQAVEKLDEAVRIHPEYPEALHLRGACRVLLSQPGPALADFTRAIRLEPNLADAYYDRAMLHIRMVEAKFVRGSLFTGQRSQELNERDRDLIRADIDALERLQIKAEKGLVARARYMMVFDEPGDALSLIEKAIEKNPTFADAYVLRATILTQRATLTQPPDAAMLQSALQDCDQAVDYDANNPEAYKVRATLSLLTNQHEKAISDLDEMVSIAPEEAQTYLDRALVLEKDPVENRSRERIRQDLDKAIQLDPENPTGRFFLAIHILESSEYRSRRDALEEARRELTFAIQADPEFMNAHVFRLVCDLALEDNAAYDRDLEAFRKIGKSLDPEQLNTLRQYVEVLARLFQGEGNIVDRVKARFEEGYEAHQRKEFKAAEECFLDVIQLCDRKSDEKLTGMTLKWYQNASRYNIACGRALSGDKDGAFEWLEKSLAAGYNRFDHMAQDSDLDPIRDDPRYQDLVKRHRGRK